MKAVIFDWGRTLYNPEEGALFSDTKSVLEYLKLKNYILAIVALATAGQSKITERMSIIEKENLALYFVSIKFDIENKDKMYEETLFELGLKHEDVFIVDDRVMRGITWGNKNGCKTIWVQNGKFANELPDEHSGNPSHTITSIIQLRDVL